jgi:hypothetical protein
VCTCMCVHVCVSKCTHAKGNERENNFC